MSEYHSRIIPDAPAEDGTPRYSLKTKSEEFINGTREEIKDTLVKQTRLYRPIRWIYRGIMITSTIYAVASITGHQLPVPSTEMDAASKQVEIALLGLFFGQGMRLSYRNDIAKWESAKNEFHHGFNEKIHMLPEKFRPRNLLKRLTGR